LQNIVSVSYWNWNFEIQSSLVWDALCRCRLGSRSKQ